MSTTFAWSLVVLAGINSTIGNILLKKSRELNSGVSFFSSLFDLWFIGGVAFYGLNVLLFAKALDVLPVSTSYPVLAGVGFAFLAVSSNMILKESLSTSQLIGLFSVLLGIILLSKG